MSYRLKRHEPLALGFVRVAHEELAGALADLGADSGARPSSEGIHEARRRLKKLRGLLRLMRPALGDEAFHRDNSAARDASRSLSPARDTAVQLATLDQLLEACGREAEELQPLRRRIAMEKTRLELPEKKATAVKAVIVRLHAILDGLGAAPVEDDTTLVCESIRRAYRRGRRALRAAKDEASDETLHELRKRVKDLHHQLLLVRRATPERCKRLLRQLDRLGDDLGLDHDLAVLAHALVLHPAVSEEALAKLRERLERRRHKLQRKVLRLAKEIFAEKPSAWLKSIARGWERWHDPR